jgi:hypothetical protein
VRRVLITALAAALVLIAVSSAIAARESLARRRQPPGRTSEKRFLTALPTARAGEPDRDDESFVKWIPIMVPLFAVVLVILVYFIVAAVV